MNKLNSIYESQRFKIIEEKEKKFLYDLEKKEKIEKGYHISHKDDLSDRHLFIIKNSHTHKKKIILFNDDFTEYYKSENKIIDYSDIFLEEKNINNKKEIVAYNRYQKIILFPSPKGIKSVKRRVIKNISNDKKLPTIEMIDICYETERGVFHTMGKSSTEQKKHYYLIPLGKEYLQLYFLQNDDEEFNLNNDTEENKETKKRNSYRTFLVENVYLEDTSPNKDWLIIQLIYKVIEYDVIKNKLKEFYTIDRQAYMLKNEKIVDVAFFDILLEKSNDNNDSTIKEKKKKIYYCRPTEFIPPISKIMSLEIPISDFNKDDFKILYKLKQKFIEFIINIYSFHYSKNSPQKEIEKAFFIYLKSIKYVMEKLNSSVNIQLEGEYKSFNLPENYEEYIDFLKKSK